MFRTSFCLLVLLFCVPATASANNIETGESCGLGIWTSSERRSNYLQWIIPALAVTSVSSLIAAVAHRKTKGSKSGELRKRWGTVTGVSLSVVILSSLIAGVVTLIHIYDPSLLY